MKAIRQVLRVLLGSAALANPTGAAQPVAHPENTLIDGPPLVATWTPPVYPPDALTAKIGGMVTVRIVVDATGHVASARALRTPDPRLGEAAVTAVKAWTYHPAIEDRKPVPMCLDVPLNFNATKGNKSWPTASLPPQEVVVNTRAPQRTGAVVKNSPIGDYPPTLAARRLSGVVAFACMVDSAGHASGLRVLGATHADFVPPALVSHAKWEFTPGMQGDLPVAGETRGEITFDPVAVSRAEVLAANGFTAPDGTPPADQPAPRCVADPIWPFDLLMKGESGTATAEFIVQEDGDVRAVKVREATQPEFGLALAAALEACTFQPVRSNGQGIPVALLKRVEFKAVSLDAAENSRDPVARLVRLGRAGEIRGGAGLDENLVPLYRVTPTYPAALLAGERPAGQAVIEFVVDRDGRARLPRIVSASHAEFGWAAATAAAQWVFKAPLRGGQPTEVRVQVPFAFNAPPPR